MTIDGKRDSGMPLDLARKEAMEDEGEMSPHHLKLLVHDFLPADSGFVFEHAIEFSQRTAVPCLQRRST